MNKLLDEVEKKIEELIGETLPMNEIRKLEKNFFEQMRKV
jgi:hypothetical protein